MAHACARWSWLSRALAVTGALVIHGLAVSAVWAAGQTDRERAGLLGPVRTVSMGGFSEAPFGVREGGRSVATYAPQGNELETAHYNSPAGGGSLIERAVHTYDAQTP